MTKQTEKEEAELTEQQAAKKAKMLAKKEALKEKRKQRKLEIRELKAKERKEKEEKEKLEEEEEGDKEEKDEVEKKEETEEKNEETEEKKEEEKKQKKQKKEKEPEMKGDTIVDPHIQVYCGNWKYSRYFSSNWTPLLFNWAPHYTFCVVLPLPTIWYFVILKCRCDSFIKVIYCFINFPILLPPPPRFKKTLTTSLPSAASSLPGSSLTRKERELR